MGERERGKEKRREKRKEARGKSKRNEAGFPPISSKILRWLLY